MNYIKTLLTKINNIFRKEQTMAKTLYKKKIKNGKEYYFYRLRHKNLKNPKDIYATTVKELDSKIKALTNALNHGVTNNK